MTLIRLVESKAVQVALRDRQALELAILGRQLAMSRSSSDMDEESGATVIRCTPLSHDRWSVFVDNAVGIIAVADLQIVVEPKIPLEHLIFLFEKANLIPRLDKRPITVSASSTLLELVARWFLSTLEVLFRDDLLHDYREERDAIRVLRGSLDVPGSVGLYYSGRPLFSCFYEQYDADTPLNRLLKAATERLASSGVFPEDLRRRSRLLARRFVGVGTLQHRDPQATTDRRTAVYADAIMLAKLLLAGESRSIESGSRRAWAFLLPTPYAVQSAITKLISEYLSDCTTAHPASISLGAGLTANPDLVFDTFNAVGDVKYKVLDGRWKRDDLYQAVAFACALESSDASILTFARQQRDVPPIATFGQLRITPIAWLADSSLEASIAARLFCEEIKRWLFAVPHENVTDELPASILNT
jgi:5-methylcytosine-specific restriction endonuclease McrBC regulatory subunit McrC